MKTLEPRGPVRFGIFEIDLRSGTLRRNGVKIRLPEQSFQVLAKLLERPGAVVSREEIRQQLWPDNTFVDFDNSINAAVNRLREALGDSAANPRFIDTLPRRGYSFIAPVHGSSSEPTPAGKVEAPTGELGTGTVLRNGTRAIVLAAAAGLGLACTAAVLWRLHPFQKERRLPPRPIPRSPSAGTCVTRRSPPMGAASPTCPMSGTTNG